MLTLITGTPGSGKTLFAVTKILEYVEQNKKLLEEGKEPRCIYADIDGLEIEGVEPAPDDWRDTPDGSVIFYDEIQQRDAFKKSRFDNEICSALQIHRHTGHDIYGITQFPVLLHPDFRAVVGMHHHLHRGWGLSSAMVFNWAYCVDAPNAPSNKKLAEHTFRFQYPKSVYKYYKSATIHTHKARIPKRFFALLAFILIMIYITFKLLFSENNFLNKAMTGRLGDSPTTQTQKNDDGNLVTVDINQQSNDNTEKSDNEQTDQQPQRIYHDQPQPNPLHQKYLQSYTLEVANDPALLPASVIAMGGKCRAYNEYGDLLNISNSDCLALFSEFGKIPKKRKQTQSNDFAYTPNTQPQPNQVQFEQSENAPINENSS